MKKINDWVIKTFGLRGSWSWAKKQMLNEMIMGRILIMPKVSITKYS
nr:MAG: hypothetical protein [Bacteriophage sp.]